MARIVEGMGTTVLLLFFCTVINEWATNGIGIDNSSLV